MPVAASFSAPVQTGAGAHPASIITLHTMHQENAVCSLLGNTRTNNHCTNDRALDAGGSQTDTVPSLEVLREMFKETAVITVCKTRPLITGNENCHKTYIITYPMKQSPS
jgi:hypothetical protein